MKKLGKKKVEAVKTIEAYGDSTICTNNSDYCECNGYVSHYEQNNRNWSDSYYYWNS
ncbi:CLI_3235 family bacteriocin precursor [Ruminiclostridium josui]|uniref:CLI_3235 family bacteriocin precursor n=1 Tax=Ruminiclostridium josui TaxID=1499 RepID=UPI000AC0C8B9|nr:CLI_3235 family bacteriocin precursor [Ruminiclostridium josui]